MFSKVINQIMGGETEFLNSKGGRIFQQTIAGT